MALIASVRIERNVGEIVVKVDRPVLDDVAMQVRALAVPLEQC